MDQTVFRIFVKLDMGVFLFIKIRRRSVSFFENVLSDSRSLTLRE